jgi:hypothetical protein
MRLISFSVLISLFVTAPVFAQTAPPPNAPPADGTAPVETPAPADAPVEFPEPVAPPSPAPPPPPAQPAAVRVYTPPPNAEASPRATSATAYNHDGFYIRWSVSSPQYWSFDAKGPQGSETFNGLGAGSMLAIGGTPAKGLVIGGAFTGGGMSKHWSGISAEGDDIQLTFGQVGLLVDWFPDPHDGWHVGGVVGLGVTILKDDDDDSFTGTSASAAILGGYDFWIGPQWALGITALAAASTTAHLKDDDRDDTGISLRPLTIGLGVSLLHH